MVRPASLCRSDRHRRHGGTGRRMPLRLDVATKLRLDEKHSPDAGFVCLAQVAQPVAVALRGREWAPIQLVLPSAQSGFLLLKLSCGHPSMPSTRPDGRGHRGPRGAMGRAFHGSGLRRDGTSKN
jgi:hypothetical protein